jgi:TatD DNase family protein
MMTDIHSHDPQIIPGQNKVLSLQLHPDMDFEAVLNALPSTILISAGIHPWHASKWSPANISILEDMLQHSRIVFIGEIGLDNACGVTYENQLFVLESQLKLAERIGKVVLIHNVGHQSELLAMKKRFKDIPAWILHGFRGKAQMAKQFISNGFYLSFGPKYQVEALRACPIDRLFVETDDSDVDLRTLYQKVADDLGITVEVLESSICRNAESLGIK